MNDPENNSDETHPAKPSETGGLVSELHTLSEKWVSQELTNEQFAVELWQLRSKGRFIASTLRQRKLRAQDAFDSELDVLADAMLAAHCYPTTTSADRRDFIEYCRSTNSKSEQQQR